MPPGTKVSIYKSATSKKSSGHQYPHRYAGKSGTVVKHTPTLGSVTIKLNDGGVIAVDHKIVSKE